MTSFYKLLLTILTLIIFEPFFATDDISLVSTKINELSIAYEKIAFSQAQGLTFKCYFDNLASFDHTGIYVNLKIVDLYNDTIYDNDSPTITVASQSLDSVAISVPFDAPATGKYTFIYVMYQDVPDAMPGNNTLTTMIYVDEFLFQRDNGEAYTSSSWAQTTYWYAIGNLYEVNGPGYVTAGSAYIHPDTEPGAYVFFNLHEFQTGVSTGNIIAESQEREITSDDIGDTIVLYFDPPVLITGQYPLGMMVGSYGGYNFEIGMSQSAPPATSFYAEMAGWAYILSTPMVRMHFDQFLSTDITDNTIWDLFPNPVSNLVRIAFDDDEQHQICISNISGKEFKRAWIYSGDQIEVNDFPAGIYFVSIDGVTKKLIVE